MTPPATPSLEHLFDWLARRLSREDLALPMLPGIAMQALELVNDPDADAAALANVIQSDQALTSHVLRVANSAAFTGYRNTTSLRQAITRLGLRTITDIVIAASLGPKLYAAPGQADWASHLWRFTLATGCWAKEIARLAHADGEEIFLCGLLHAVGKPIVLRELGALPPAERDALDDDTVDRLLDAFHRQVGARLAREWHLPEAVELTITWLEEPEDAPASQGDIRMVRCARELATWQMSDSPPPASQLATHPDFSVLGLGKVHAEALLERWMSVDAQLQALNL